MPPQFVLPFLLIAIGCLVLAEWLLRRDESAEGADTDNEGAASS